MALLHVLGRYPFTARYGKGGRLGHGRTPEQIAYGKLLQLVSVTGHRLAAAARVSRDDRHASELAEL